MGDFGMTSVLLIAGRSGVGKSTVSYEVSTLLRHHDVAHVLVDGDNLDAAYPKPAGPKLIELTKANLAAIWRNYRELGHRRMIYVNTMSVLDEATIRHALGGPVAVTGVLLTADDRTIRERLGRREIGSLLEFHVERSASAAGHLETTAAASVHRVPTAGRSVREIAEEIVTLTGWSDQALNNQQAVSQESDKA